jgi:hypothetical protein
VGVNVCDRCGESCEVLACEFCVTYVCEVCQVIEDVGTCFGNLHGEHEWWPQSV